MKCIRCEQDSLDLRYFWNDKIQSYEIEYHCTYTLGGCNFYRVVSLNYDGQNFSEEEE